jgi:hypothetical protein
VSATVVIVVEGVLRGTGDAIHASGLRLYHGLNSAEKIALISSDNEPRVSQWLKVNGLNKHTHLITIESVDFPDPIEQRIRQVNLLRRQGCDIDFVVEPDPAMAAALLAKGVPVMVALHPSYSRPEFRPGYKGSVTPWDELEHEVTLMRELRASDERTGLDPL